MVRTGAHAYLKYGYESTFGTSASTLDKKFGLNDAISSWTLTHNRQDLPALNQVTIDEYAYGQQAGTLGIDFTLSNPWVFKTILGDPSTTGSNPYVHTYPHASNGINKTPTSFTTEVGFDGASADTVRTLKGCVATSLSITASVGNLVSASLSANYGVEDAPSTSLGTAPSQPDVEFPYTFAHATLKYGGNTLAQVQDLSLNIDQGSSLLYGLGDHQAVDAYRQLLDITGSFRVSLLNKTVLEDMLEQISKGTSGSYSSTVGGSPELEIAFTKDSNEKIVITGTGLSPTDLSYDGFRANEPIFENVNWRIKTLTVAATNAESTPE